MSEKSMKELAGLIHRLTREDGAHPTAIAPLSFFRASAPSEPVPVVYGPSFCLVAQGSKQMLLASDVYRYDPAQFLLITVDLPVQGQIIQASPEVPYLSLTMNLDLPAVSDLVLEAALPEARDAAPCSAISVNPVEAPLLSALVRLLALLDSPRDIPVLAPLVIREITYRLLTGAQGARLRQIAAGDGQGRRVAQAVRWLRDHFAEPLRIAELARHVGMSPSALHHHFKVVTTISPLQYQKRLRLQEARRLMLTEGLDAAESAFRVGYESPSQFSREYRRMYGTPPRRDVVSRRQEPQGLRV